MSIVVNKNTREPVETSLLWWGERGKPVRVRDVFSGVGIETDQGRFGIAQLDGGIEVMLNGELVWSSSVHAVADSVRGVLGGRPNPTDDGLCSRCARTPSECVCDRTDEETKCED